MARIVPGELQLTAFFRDFAEQADEMDDIRDFASRSTYRESMRNPEVAAWAARELLDELRVLSGEEEG